MKVIILTACLSILFLFNFSTQTFAVDFTINMSGDLPDASVGDSICQTAASNCSLRAAVQEANALASNDRVIVPANLTVTLTIANGGEISILNNGVLEISGAGANTSTINGGTGTNRIFYTNNAVVTISGVTLTGGDGTGAFSSDDGGAIYASNGALTLDRVHVTGNTAAFGGGGVDFAGGAHRIINSTFSGNTANLGGAFIDDGGTLTVINSTISGNIGLNGGGGFSNFGGNITLRNSTITNNTSSIGGGIVHFQGMINIGNTIVAGNIATDNSYPEIEFGGGVGTITSTGGNLVGDSAGDSTSTGFGTITYQTTDLTDVNPLLGTLSNNGGTTPTHPVLAGSPVIDAGVNSLAVDPSNGNAALTTDQRGAGFTRIVDGNNNAAAVVDIGAFERQLGVTAASVSVSGRVKTALGRGIGNARVAMIDSSGVDRTVLSNALGYYSFANITAGETYTFSIFHKRYNFNESTRVYTIVEELNDLDFISNN